MNRGVFKKMLEKYNDIYRNKETLSKEIDALKLKVKRAHNLIDNATELETQNIKVYKSNLNRLTPSPNSIHDENSKDSFELIYNQKMTKLNKYKEALKHKIFDYEQKLKNLNSLLERHNFYSLDRQNEEELLIGYVENKKIKEDDILLEEDDDNMSREDKIIESINYDEINENIRKIMEKFKQDLIETIKEEYSNFETLNNNSKEELKNILNNSSSQKQFQIVIDFDSLIQFYKNFTFKRDIIDRFKNVNIKKSSLIVITVLIISILFILLYISSNRNVINKNENNNDRIRELKKQTKKIDTIDVTNTLKIIFNRLRIKFKNCLFSIYNFIMIDDFD
jgi:hypothetical protein